MTRTTTNHRWHRLARPVLSALAACGLLAALAAPAAADQVSLNKASPILFRATEGAGAPADAPAAPTPGASRALFGNS